MSVNRRFFLKSSAVAAIPAFLPVASSFANESNSNNRVAGNSIIKFFGDGEMFEPAEYISELQKAHTSNAIVRDRYGLGGVVEAMEKKFVEITGKEQAIYMPSGTMANQFAIATLCGENTKVFVQDTSHVYRDEADAAQSVFGKRLMPLAKDETFFTAQQLQEAIASLSEQEVFKSGVGAVSIENPVRRTSERMVPIGEIKKISSFCRSNNIGLHLDGARVYMASAWSGISVKEYCSYFDTVYISLYKYFGAAGGAILCGEKSVIDKMPHLIKIHGGNMYSNWTNAAMALYRLEGFEQRLQDSIKQANELFSALNKTKSFKISPLDGGTNIYKMELAKEIDGKKMQEKLRTAYDIRIGLPNDKNVGQLTVNETILYQPVDYIIKAFKKSAD
ncbi:threonine aldolase family protein [Terrimonas alba]|uniref:threonine aldolase family protein n=1 Tax=Terrimonas alba TaxID=3349636 RepID=UPI0035F38834